MAFWFTFILWAATLVLSELMKPKSDVQKAGIGDFQVPTATEGRPVPILWGTVRMAGPNVVWYGDLEQKGIYASTGLFSEEVVGYRYYLGFQFALCKGVDGDPVDELTRIWIGDDIVFDGSVSHGDTLTIDKPNLFGGEKLGSGGIRGTLEFFAGTNTQSASTYLADFQDISGKTPAYRGICYLANWKDPAPDDPANPANRIYIGTSTSLKPWKFEGRRTPNPIGLTANRHIVNGRDANPACVIYEVLTSPEFFGIAAAKIDTSSLVTAGNTLYDEGNGFSFLLDSQEEPGDMLRRVEEQIDGTVYLDQTTGLYKLSLARDDYDVDLIPELNDTNVIEVETFTRILWPQTKNEVRAEFNDADDDYKLTYAFAQDMANIRIQDGNRSSEQPKFVGVKSAQLAADIAWRDLRTLAFPLANARLVCTRAVYGAKVGDVYAWTNSQLGFVRLPVRVKHVDGGELVDGRIVLEVVQDVFRSAAASFAPPPSTAWTPPGDDLAAIPSDEQLAFEAPRGLTVRKNPAAPYVDKVYAAARLQGVEVSFKITARHSAGTPTGAYAEIGEGFGFVKIGELSSTLPAGSAVPLSTLTIVPTPDSQTAIESLFPDVTDIVGLGTDLTTLIYVDGEFMLVTSAQTSASNVQLNGVYRGLLDSVQTDHASGASVFVLFAGAALSDDTITAGDNVDVKLLPNSTTDTVAEADATAISFAMSNRTRRPYAPSELSLNGTRFPSSASLEGTGSGEADGLDLDFIRRDFRTEDEIAALSTDAATIFTDYPSAYSTTHEVDVVDYPGGSPTTLFTQDLASGNSGTIPRLEILKATDGVIPSTLGLKLRSTHVFGGSSFDSFVDLEWDFSPTTALSGSFNFGALDSGDISNAFAVTTAVDHVFALSSAFTAGDVEYRINGGTWTTLIAAGNTSGTILASAIAVSDTIEVRHLGTDTDALKLLTMTVSSVLTAYAILFT